MVTLLFFVAGIGAFVYLASKIEAVEQKISTQGRSPYVSQATTPLTPLDVHGQPMSVINPPPPVPQLDVHGQPIQVTVPPPKPAAASGGFDEVSGGRWLGRLGIGAIFIGIAFFLKYAFDTNLIGTGGRVLLGVMAGMVFIVAGQILRAKYQQYADLFIGGGVAILYLSFYVAYALYDLISQPVAFGLLMLVTVVAICLSYINDSEPLAVLTVLGGFVTPYLVSNGHNDPVSLFSYIVILDVVVVALATRKNWVTLTFMSFFGTGMQYLAWYGAQYVPAQLPVAFLFLTFFYLLYLSLPTIGVLRDSQKTKDEDLVLATMSAAGYFWVAYMLLNPAHHGTIWVLAVVLGAVYYLLAFLTYNINKAYILLCQYYAGIATIFLTIAIPLKLGHSWSTLAWLIESLLLFALAFEYKYKSFQTFAGVVYVLAVCKLFAEYLVSSSNVAWFFNEYAGLFCVAIAIAYIVSYLYHAHPEAGVEHESLAATFFVVANVLSVYILTSQIVMGYANEIELLTNCAQRAGGGCANISSQYADLMNQRNTVISIVWSVCAMVPMVIGFVVKVRLARMLGLIFFFITACKVFVDVWSFGELYRIVASILFGAIALLASFLYVKYSQRIKEIIY